MRFEVQETVRQFMVMLIIEDYSGTPVTIWDVKRIGYYLRHDEFELKRLVEQHGGGVGPMLGEIYFRLRAEANAFISELDPYVVMANFVR